MLRPSCNHRRWVNQQWHPSNVDSGRRPNSVHAYGNNGTTYSLIRPRLGKNVCVSRTGTEQLYNTCCDVQMKQSYFFTNWQWRKNNACRCFRATLLKPQRAHRAKSGSSGNPPRIGLRELDDRGEWISRTPLRAGLSSPFCFFHPGRAPPMNDQSPYPPIHRRKSVLETTTNCG